MTISSTTTSYRYEGNGVTDTFAFSGRVFTQNDLVVEIITRATDVLEETLTITTDYTVTINSEESASITTVAGKIPSATQDIQIRRSLTQSQTVDLPTGTVFPAKSVEDALDKNVAILQELNSDLSRSVKLPATSSLSDIELVAPVAYDVIGWDSAGTALTSYAFGDISVAIDTAFSVLANGDLLQYNSTSSLWENKTVASLLTTPSQDLTPDGVNDLLLTYDNSASVQKKIGINQVFYTLNSLSTETTIDQAGDYLAFYDTTASNARKATVGNIARAIMLDEDDMSSDSATSTASQQSVKAYVDNNIATSDRTASAWVCFDGTGTPAVKDSYNVSGTITDNGAGDYTFTFTTALADANYVAVASAGGASAAIYVALVYGKSTTGFSVYVTDVAATAQDLTDVNVIIFGGK